MELKEQLKLIKDRAKTITSRLKALNKGKKNNDVILSLLDNLFIQELTVNFDLYELSDDELIEKLKQCNIIIEETCVQNKERLEKEKENKNKLKEIKLWNNEFIKFLNTLSSDEYGLTAKTNMLNMINATENITDFFTMSFLDDKIEIIYARRDYTQVKLEIKKSYYENLIPQTLAKITECNIKNLLINSEKINILRKAKSAEIISLNIDNNGLHYELFVDSNNTTIDIENIDKPYEFIKYENNSVYTNEIALTNADSDKLDTEDIEVKTNIGIFVIPYKTLKIILKSDFKLRYTLMQNNLVEFISEDENIKATQIVRVVLSKIGD